MMLGWRVLADRDRLGRPGSRLPLHTSIAGLGGGISWRPPAYSLFLAALQSGMVYLCQLTPVDLEYWPLNSQMSSSSSLTLANVGRLFTQTGKGLEIKESAYKFDKYLYYSTVLEESKVPSHLTSLVTNTTDG